MAIRGTSPRYLAISKKFNGDLSYRVGEARELTLKGSLASPTSLLRMVPDICIKESKAFDYQMYPGIFLELSIWQAY
jgi:hypothetical protein